MYLGYIVDKDSLQKSPKKVEAIITVPEPGTVTQLKRFLGMANYYRNFIPNVLLISALVDPWTRGRSARGRCLPQPTLRPGGPLGFQLEIAVTK